MTNESRHSDSRGWCNRPLVRETDGRRVRSLWKALLAVVVAIAPTAVYLVQQNQSVKLSYQVADLEVANEQLVKQELELQAETARLEVLQEIERWASTKRGLNQPASGDVVIVRIDRSRSSALLARQSSGATADTPR